jgi:hypothetical protein
LWQRCRIGRRKRRWSDSGYVLVRGDGLPISPARMAAIPPVDGIDRPVGPNGGQAKQRSWSLSPEPLAVAGRSG